MKTALKLSAFLLVFLAFSCKDKTAGTKAVTGAAEKAPATTKVLQSTIYKLDSGVLNWTGSKALGDSHQGTINVSNGKLAVADGAIQAGDFIIDMASITNTDMEAGKGKEKLEGHLKNADFFNVEQFPTGTFKIISVTPAAAGGDATHNVKGNLTLKGIEKSVTIPANVAIAGGKVSVVTPSFTINRTDWGISYGSGSLADLAKDKIINDDIALVLQLSASPAPVN